MLLGNFSYIENYSLNQSGIPFMCENVVTTMQQQYATAFLERFVIILVIMLILKLIETFSKNDRIREGAGNILTILLIALLILSII
jgi:hypothetical protein